VSSRQGSGAWGRRELHGASAAALCQRHRGERRDTDSTHPWVLNNIVPPDGDSNQCLTGAFTTAADNNDIECKRLGSKFLAQGMQPGTTTLAEDFCSRPQWVVFLHLKTCSKPHEIPPRRMSRPCSSSALSHRRGPLLLRVIRSPLVPCSWHADSRRRCSIEKKLADANVSEEEQHNIVKQFEKKEAMYMRLQRHKLSGDDFDLLTMIGKGAFGEVKSLIRQTI
jgi:hypothetical protein